MQVAERPSRERVQLSMETADDLDYPPPSWIPRPDQFPVWLDLQRAVPNILVIGHRQWGKDEVFLRGAGLQAIKKPASYVYCLPRTNQVRRNMWEAVNPHTGISRIEETFPSDCRLKKLDQTMTIQMPVYEPEKYSSIAFTGSDNYDGLRGMVGWGYTFSEWAFCDPRALSVIRPIVEGNGGLLRFVTSSFGQNHAYKMLLDNATKPDWRCYLITNNKRHPLLSDPKAKDIIHIQSHRIPEHRMKVILEENIQLYGPDIGQAVTEQEYECSFEEIVPGSYYMDLLLKAEREGRILNMAPRPDLPVYAAFDLGFTDPTSIWFVQIKEDGWVDVVDYDEITRTSIPELIPVLRNKSWYYAELQLPHDGPHHEVTSGTTTEKILTTAGFRVRTMPRTDDGAQIPSVRQLLPRCRFANTRAVQRGLECLRHYHNKAKQDDGGRTSWSPKPVHDWSSHAAKAFATLAYFAPTLTSGVSAPPGKAAQPYQPLHAGAGGWMA